MTTKILTTVIIMLICGCKTTAKELIHDAQIPPSLLTPCPDLPKITSGKAGDVAKYIIKIKGMYRVCSSRHGALAGAVKKTAE